MTMALMSRVYFTKKGPSWLTGRLKNPLVCGRLLDVLRRFSLWLGYIIREVGHFVMRLFKQWFHLLLPTILLTTFFGALSALVTHYNQAPATAYHAHGFYTAQALVSLPGDYTSAERLDIACANTLQAYEVRAAVAERHNLYLTASEMLPLIETQPVGDQHCGVSIHHSNRLLAANLANALADQAVYLADPERPDRIRAAIDEVQRLFERLDALQDELAALQAQQDAAREPAEARLLYVQQAQLSEAMTLLRAELDAALQHRDAIAAPADVPRIIKRASVLERGWPTPEGEALRGGLLGAAFGVLALTLVMFFRAWFDFSRRLTARKNKR